MTSKNDRRSVLGGFVGASLAAGLSARQAAAASSVKAPTSPVFPRQLKPGDTAMLVAPAGVIYDELRFTLARESLQAMGLTVKFGAHAMDRHGYLAGTDEARAADFNAAFADPAVDAVFCLRGGWGCARMLPFVNFDVVKANPKVLVGYSDVTTLLNAVYKETGLVSFHGPNGDSAWYDESWKAFEALVFKGRAPRLADTPEAKGTLTKRMFRAQTLRPGEARGRLIGGNLTLITNLMGTPYLPDMAGHILCVEEVGEWVYRCDRMLTQLANGGVLDEVAGVVLGTFSGCTVEPNGGYGTFSLMDVFKHHFAERDIPCFFGLNFGHIKAKLTIPFGVMARMNADQHWVELEEPAVQS